jgi:hypothetical protein
MTRRIAAIAWTAIAFIVGPYVEQNALAIWETWRYPLISAAGPPDSFRICAACIRSIDLAGGSFSRTVSRLSFAVQRCRLYE